MKQSALRILAQATNALKMMARIFLMALILILITGCASIVDGGRKPVRIRSNPTGATVAIFDRRGRQVWLNTTPTTAFLKRGGFFRRDSYRLDFGMPGFQSRDTLIKPKINPWYFGNFLLLPFSPIGFLVDPATGAMWTISPRTINVTLTPSNAH